MSSKKQQTFAKLNRERAVKEKRERKAEKKAAAAAERARIAEFGPDGPPPELDEDAAAVPADHES
jgi:hypothetical protein